MIKASFTALYVCLAGPPFAIAYLLAQKRKCDKCYESKQQEMHELEERIWKLSWELKDATAKLDETSTGSKAEGFTKGKAYGLAQGHEEGYTLGMAEGYKYALYTQGRYRYFLDRPPLTYEDAQERLIYGVNGEAVEPVKKNRKKKALPEEPVTE